MYLFSEIYIWWLRRASQGDSVSYCSYYSGRVALKLVSKEGMGQRLNNSVILTRLRRNICADRNASFIFKLQRGAQKLQPLKFNSSHFFLLCTVNTQSWGYPCPVTGSLVNSFSSPLLHAAAGEVVNRPFADIDSGEREVFSRSSWTWTSPVHTQTHGADCRPDCWGTQYSVSLSPATGSTWWTYGISLHFLLLETVQVIDDSYFGRYFNIIKLHKVCIYIWFLWFTYVSSANDDEDKNRLPL